MNQFSPYEPPQSSRYLTPDAAPHRPAVRPGVLTWYAVYCYLMALLYLLVVGIGIAFIVFSDEIAEADAEMKDPAFVIVMGAVFMAISLPLMILFVAGPLLPRKHWVWIYGFVPICVGLTSVCTLPFSVALLIFWLKPETKAWYGAT